MAVMIVRNSRTLTTRRGLLLLESSRPQWLLAVTGRNATKNSSFATWQPKNNLLGLESRRCQHVMNKQHHHPHSVWNANRRRHLTTTKNNNSNKVVEQQQTKPPPEPKVSPSSESGSSTSSSSSSSGGGFSLWWNRFIGPKEMPPRWTLPWYREVTLICTVFAITGSSTMVLVRPAVSNGLGLKGSMKDGPWAYRICSLVIMTPIYASLLVCVGTVFGRHYYFRHFSVKMWSRFGIPPEMLDPAFHETKKHFRKW